LINSESTNSNDFYIRSKEIINLLDVNNNLVLRSHEFSFTIDDETYQEVAGHEGKNDENDEV
jgi:hypothetical protein